MRTRPALLTIAAAIISCAAFAATAGALFHSSAGKEQLQMLNAGETNTSSTNSTAFTNLTFVSLNVPPNQKRVINARFTADSRCSKPTGPAAGICSVRIMALRVNGALAQPELQPVDGANYAFDSDEPGSAKDLREGHAMERDLVLPPGDYRIAVQRKVQNGAIRFYLGHWHLAVEVSAA